MIYRAAVCCSKDPSTGTVLAVDAIKRCRRSPSADWPLSVIGVPHLESGFNLFGDAAGLAVVGASLNAAVRNQSYCGQDADYYDDNQ